MGNTELYEGPGAGFGTPFLEVTCTDTTMVVQSNGLPHYAYQAMTPNGLAAQNFTWEIPLAPNEGIANATIPCLGTAGFSVNGIPLYGPNEAAFPDPYGDPIANGVMDFCLGHTGGQADYHYHGLYEDCMDKAETGPSELLGFALDGFPIYGPRGCVDADCREVLTFKSSWNAIHYESTDCSSDSDCGAAYTCADAMVGGVAKSACVYKDYAWEYNEYSPQDGEEFLDECNGRVGPDGTYRYHATPTFPYLMGCYRGVLLQGGGNINACPVEAAGGGETGGGMEGGGMGPTPCEGDTDCVGECGGGTGCICDLTPMGMQICVPTCATDTDCPDTMMGLQFACNSDGICVPADGMMGP